MFCYMTVGKATATTIAQSAIFPWIVPCTQDHKAVSLSTAPARIPRNVQHLQLNISAKHGWLVNAHQSVVQIHPHAAKLDITTCPSHGQMPVMPQSCPWISAPVLSRDTAGQPMAEITPGWKGYWDFGWEVKTWITNNYSAMILQSVPGSNYILKNPTESAQDFAALVPVGPRIRQSGCQVLQNTCPLIIWTGFAIQMSSNLDLEPSINCGNALALFQSCWYVWLFGPTAILHSVWNSCSNPELTLLLPLHQASLYPKRCKLPHSAAVHSTHHFLTKL